MKTTPTTQKQSQVSSVIGNFSKAQVFLPISADAEPDSGLGFGWFTHTTNKHNK